MSTRSVIIPDTVVSRTVKVREGGGAKGCFYRLITEQGDNGITAEHLLLAYGANELPGHNFDRWLFEMANQGYVELVPSTPKLTLVPTVTE
jgi:hypothetical protein